MKCQRQQTGITTVEFAIVGFVLLLAIFTVIEIGRLLWTWESLAEAARRGARVAAVCPVDHPAIANIAVFNDPATSGPSAIINGLDTSQIQVSYLDEDGIELTADPANCEWGLIKYVRVRIEGYVFNYVVPIVGTLVNAPSFETTLPSESLGLVPFVGYECFGVSWGPQPPAPASC